MLIPVLLALILAQTPASPSTDARAINATRAAAWLAAAYPALRRGDVTIRIAGDGERLHLEVLDEPAAQPPGPRASIAALTVDLRYAADGRVEKATADGPLVQSAALDALKKAIAAHPDWTDAQIATAIANAGGQFGPTAAAKIETAIPLASALLRADATVTSSTFNARDARGPVWTTDVTSGTRTYQFTFEPIGGQLIAVAAK